MYDKKNVNAKTKCYKVLKTFHVFILSLDPFKQTESVN